MLSIRRGYMRNIKFLVRRNIALFMTNYLNILLSFLSILIVVSLYVLFLRDFLFEYVAQSGVRWDLVPEFTDRIIFAGLLVVINTTSCFGILQIYVQDIDSKIIKDFTATPISSFELLSGYWVASVLVSTCFTCFTVLGVECFFGVKYGSILTLQSLFYIVMIVLISSFINSGILLIVAKYIKNTASFLTFVNLYGTVIGFLAGTYLPNSFYPEWLRKILFYYPPTHLNSILRQEYMTEISSRLYLNTDKIMLEQLFNNMGVFLKQDHVNVPLTKQWAFLILTAAILLFFHWYTNFEHRTKRTTNT